MHIAHKILPERDEEQDSQHTTKQRTHEHLKKIHCKFRVFCLKDIKCREGKDCTCHNCARTCSNRLDNYILSKSIFSLQCSRQTHSNNSNWNCRLKHLPHLKAKISSSSRENDCHYKAQRDTPGINLGINLCWREYRLILLTRLEFPCRILRQTGCFNLSIFHIIIF